MREAMGTNESIFLRLQILIKTLRRKGIAVDVPAGARGSDWVERILEHTWRVRPFTIALTFHVCIHPIVAPSSAFVTAGAKSTAARVETNRKDTGASDDAACMVWYAMAGKVTFEANNQ